MSSLKIRSALCWGMTASVAVAAASAVMGTSPTTIHRMWIAVSLALMVLLNGWLWSTLQPKDNAVNAG
ncbi:MAG: hypothetical protein JWP89_225 [Schlesneria sp.]|nr:hypothetical protein [Schlesneria sp.]